MNTEFIVADKLITLHTAEPCDEGFLLQVYASTREDEMSLVDWSEDQKSTFIKMQFDAQTHHYQVHFPTGRVSHHRNGRGSNRAFDT